MSMIIKHIQDWLKTIPDDRLIAIDEGGLSLVAFHPQTGGVQDYLTIGSQTMCECEKCDWHGPETALTDRDYCPQCGKQVIDVGGIEV